MNNFTFLNIPLHKKKLTLKKFNIYSEIPEYLKVYKETTLLNSKTNIKEPILQLPKYYKHPQTTIHDYNYLKNTSLTFRGKLRDKQQEIINTVLPLIRKEGGGVLDISVGAGKTVMALYIASLLKVPVLILCHKLVLVEQWKEKIKEFIIEEKPDIEVITIQSILFSNRTDNPKFYKTGLLIIDEVHHIGAETFNTCCFNIINRFQLGLSGTTKRDDGMEKAVYLHLGNLLYSYHPTNIIQHTAIRTKFCPEITLNVRGQVNYIDLVTQITKNEQRNKLIVELIPPLIKEGRKVLVLSARRNHCEVLCELLGMGFVFMGGVENGFDDAKDANPIFATVGIAEEGLDLALDTLIFATPMKKITQAVGRINRGHTPFSPLVFDLIDKLGLFEKQYYERKKAYGLVKKPQIKDELI